MANIKNFGIKGIASDVQLGKGGGFVVYNSGAGRFEFKDSGSALENETQLKVVFLSMEIVAVCTV